MSTTTPANLRLQGLHALGGAPTKSTIALAGLWFFLAIALVGSAVIVLVSLLGVRVASMAMLVEMGPAFGVGMGVLVALGALIIVFYIVYKHSRGTLFGRQLKSTGDELDKLKDDVVRDESGARDGLREAAEQLREGDAILARADDNAAREIEETLVGIKVAALVLGVKEIVAPVYSKVVTPAQPLRAQYNAKAATVRSDAAILVKRLQEGTLETLGDAPDAYAATHQPHQGGVDVADLDPTAQPGLVAATDRSRRHVPWWMILLGALLLAILVGAGITVATGAFAAATGADPTADPTSTADGASSGLVEGVDYAFLSGSGDNAAGWSCSAPITVSLMGDYPVGANATLAAAVASIGSASGLPLQLGADGTPGDITVSYLPSADVEAKGGDDGAIGVASPIIVGGSITSATVVIDEESPSNDPASYLAVLVLEHELGHAVGLDHVDHGGELMQPQLDPTLTGLGEGDLRGLQLVGC
ncbi:MAG: matrixin family metalloprotease [Salinibacterium sp.]|nr:matrixin family metalloprotease [Salinibacterium sp.]